MDSIVPAAGSMTCRSATGKVNLINDNTKKWHYPVPAPFQCSFFRECELKQCWSPLLVWLLAPVYRLNKVSIVSKGASVKQLQFEVKNLTRKEREAILHSIPEAAITIPPEQILAMKADLSIPWNKLRVVRR